MPERRQKETRERVRGRVEGGKGKDKEVPQNDKKIQGNLAKVCSDGEGIYLSIW